jgi:hypothetical protein
MNVCSKEKPSTSWTLIFTTTYSCDNYDAITGLAFTTVMDPNGKVTKQGYDQWAGSARASRSILPRGVR